MRENTTIDATAMAFARRGMPRPARWSCTIRPTPGRFSTQRSSRSLDFVKQAAAAMKNTVVGSPGTITPNPPRPTHTSPAMP